MKNIIFITSLALSMLFAVQTFAQKFPDLDKSPHDISYLKGKDKSPLIKVIYGRPQKNGRTIFGDLEPYGKVWRTGANEATEIKFYKDAKVDGKMIKAGTYTLFTIPEKDKWTIIFNSENDQWGAYNYNKDKDVLRTDVKTIQPASPLEALTISFSENETGGDMYIGWDNTLVKLPIVIPVK